MINDTILKLIDKNISISFAESCTGGELASTLTKVAGVSKIFKGSFVTYSNEYKNRFLNVPQGLIDKYGVVSKEVAESMVIGLYNITSSDISISVTGNAGPSKGDINEPVGRVYVGIKYKDIEVFELNINKDRISIINDVRDFVFNKINELIGE